MRTKLLRNFARILAGLAVAVFGFTPVFGQSKPAPKTKVPSNAAAASVDIPIPDIPCTKFVLPNGLTVIVHEDRKAPIVAVNTWYHVGSKNETPGKTGFAHLFEHLMFSGSENLDSNFGSVMNHIGATENNGGTNNDRTNYHENVPTSMLDYVLFAESDRMGYLLGVLDQKKLDLQRGVVQNEKRQVENQPYGVVEQIVTENTYPAGHPYSWTTIGSMKDLDAASMSDVQEWFKTYYGPNNATLVIAGDITPEVAREKVEKYYGEIPAGPPIIKREAWVAKRTGTHRDAVQDRVPQARLYRVWNVPQRSSPEQALLDIVARILGGGQTSRLYKRLVYKDQTASSATAEDDTNEIAGQFTYTLTAKPGVNLKKVEMAADEELQNFLKDGPTEVELRIAKTQIVGNYARNMERIGGYNGGETDILARCQTFTGNPGCYRDYLKQILVATPATVKKAAHDWLTDGDYILEVQPYPADFKTTTKMDRSKAPALGSAMPLKFPPVQKATLSNGLKIVLAERHTAPLVYFSLNVERGDVAGPGGEPGTADFAFGMLKEGTRTRDSLQIGEELESLNSTIVAGADLDVGFIDLNALTVNVDESLKIYADLILHPTFPEKEFARLQKIRLAAIQREKVTPQDIVNRLGLALLYGKGHPYAEPSTGSGTDASISTMTRDDLVKFHDTWFKPNNSTLLVVGDTTLADVRPKLDKLFASWKPSAVTKRTVPQVSQPEKDVVYLIDRPGSSQSAVFSGQLAPPPNGPDEASLELVNGVFGGNFSSRLNSNLREDKHWTLGAATILASAPGQRPFYSYTTVQTDKTKESLVELLKEYKNITGGKPITAAELKDQQSYATLGLPGNFETNGQLVGAYLEIMEDNLPEDYFNTLTEKMWAVTPAIANEIAKKYILPDHLVWIVVGDMSKVEAGIRELNIGEVHRIDADGNPVK